MGYHGLHINKLTGEVLAQDVQICTMCWKNFSSDDAWDIETQLINSLFEVNKNNV